jgi:hypothetical protein
MKRLSRSRERGRGRRELVACGSKGIGAKEGGGKESVREMK